MMIDITKDLKEGDTLYKIHEHFGLMILSVYSVEVAAPAGCKVMDVHGFKYGLTAAEINERFGLTPDDAIAAARARIECRILKLNALAAQLDTLEKQGGAK